MGTIEIGSAAERAAAEYLFRSGYRIAAVNWRRPQCEIDIVAFKDDRAYLVEVKFRSNSGQGDGFNYITAEKLRHMRRAAAVWTTATGWQGEVCLMAASVDKDLGIEVLEIEE